MDKVLVSVKKSGKSFLTKIFLPGVIVIGLTWASFVWFGPFSSLAFSNRLFVVGAVFMGLGTAVVFAQMITGRGSEIFFGGNKDRIDKAKKFLNAGLDDRMSKEKRYNVGAMVWLIGIFCILASIAVSFIVK